MKQRFFNILNIIGVKSNRTKNIVKHISISFFYKVGAILANFLLVPLTIGYLDKENYGVWLTLSSFIAWFSFFDIGLGNGLRNKVAEAKTNNQIHLTKAYISTAYYTIFVISVFLFLVFFIINFFVDWTLVFNTSKSLKSDLEILMPIIVGFFCMQLVVSLITNIYYASQNHSMQIKIHFFTQALSLILIWLLTKTSNSSLLLFGTIFSALPVFILIIINVFAFSNRFKEFKPSFKFWNKKLLKDIMGIGFDFFIIQIAGIVLFSTDNFIISKLFSPEEVVPYNISFKYFSIVNMAFTIILTPYWSSFTEAFVKNEYQWIKTSIKNIVRFWILIPVILIIMLILSKWFYGFWVGSDIIIPIELSVSMALFTLLFTFNNIFIFFINGVGKIKLQLVVSVLSMLFNIPLSIYFAKGVGLGLSGVILATAVTIAISAVLSPIQYFKIINLKAKGIWNS